MHRYIAVNLPLQDTQRYIYKLSASYRAVFLFRILEMGAGSSELGKSAREIPKLGKVEMYLKPQKYSNHVPRHYKIELPCIFR